MRLSYWPAPTQPFEEVLDLSLHAEQAGYDGVWFADHFMPNAPDTSAPWAEAWTTLAALGARVPRIRLGTLVSGNTYRHPAVLAKMIATLDQITGGRVVLGLGSGWQENEHQQYGIEFLDVARRLEMLDEACQVIRSLFTEKQTSFDGKYYQLKDASLEPKPSHAPLMIGGGGEKVTLKITARWADEWNVWGGVDVLKHKMSILDAHCADVGRDPAAIERSAVALLFMSDDQAFLEKMRANPAPMASVIGTPEEVLDTMNAYGEAGVTEYILPGFNLGPADNVKKTLDTFAEKIIARL